MSDPALGLADHVPLAHVWDRVVADNIEWLWMRATAAGLSAAQARDVCELVWFRLGQALPGLEPGQVHQWLSATIRRELATERQRTSTGTATPTSRAGFAVS